MDDDFISLPPSRRSEEYTHGEAAEAASLSPQQRKVYQFLKEGFFQNGATPTLRELCKFMGWSAVGTAQSVVAALIEKGFLEKDSHKARSLRPKNILSFKSAPIVGSAPAGSPFEAYESHDGDVMIPDFLRGPVFAVRVKGDSMQDAGILDGDLVIVREEKSAKPKDIVVASLDGEVTIKRFSQKGSDYWLLPENKKYKPIRVEGDFKILGKVIGVHRYW